MLTMFWYATAVRIPMNDTLIWSPNESASAIVVIATD